MDLNTIINTITTNPGNSAAITAAIALAVNMLSKKFPILSKIDLVSLLTTPTTPAVPGTPTPVVPSTPAIPADAGLSRLVQAAEAVAAGNFDVSVKISATGTEVSVAKRS